MGAAARVAMTRIGVSGHHPNPLLTFSFFLPTAWGWTDEISDGGIHGIDGTGGDFPRYTVVEDNVFREIGVWEKQSSAFFQAKTAESTLRRNVVFNLARAGFNFVGFTKIWGMGGRGGGGIDRYLTLLP